MTPALSKIWLVHAECSTLQTVHGVYLGPQLYLGHGSEASDSQKAVGALVFEYQQ